MAEKEAIMIAKDSPTYCFIPEVYSHFSFGENKINIDKISVNLGRPGPFFTCDALLNSAEKL